MRPPFSQVPLLPVFVAFSAGVVAGLSGTGVWWALAVALAALLCRRIAGDMALVALISLAAGLVAGAFGRPPHLPDGYAAHRMYWQGVVVETAETAGGRRITVDMDSVGPSA